MDRGRIPTNEHLRPGFLLRSAFSRLRRLQEDRETMVPSRVLGGLFGQHRNRRTRIGRDGTTYPPLIATPPRMRRNSFDDHTSPTPIALQAQLAERAVVRARALHAGARSRIASWRRGSAIAWVRAGDGPYARRRILPDAVAVGFTVPTLVGFDFRFARSCNTGGAKLAVPAVTGRGEVIAACKQGESEKNFVHVGNLLLP